MKSTKTCQMTQSKQCGRCKEVKLLSEFNSDKNSLTGVTCYCKSCQKSSNHKHYLKGKYQFRFDGPSELLDDIRDDMNITEIKEIIKFYQH